MHPEGVRHKVGLFLEYEYRYVKCSQKISPSYKVVEWNSVCGPASTELLMDHTDLEAELHASANGSHSYNIWKIFPSVSGLCLVVASCL